MGRRCAGAQRRGGRGGRSRAKEDWGTAPSGRGALWPSGERTSLAVGLARHPSPRVARRHPPRRRVKDRAGVAPCPVEQHLPEAASPRRRAPPRGGAQSRQALGRGLRGSRRPSSGAARSPAVPPFFGGRRRAGAKDGRFRRPNDGTRGAAEAGERRKGRAWTNERAGPWRRERPTNAAAGAAVAGSRSRAALKAGLRGLRLDFLAARLARSARAPPRAAPATGLRRPPSTHEPLGGPRSPWGSGPLRRRGLPRQGGLPRRPRLPRPPRPPRGPLPPRPPRGPLPP